MASAGGGRQQGSGRRRQSLRSANGEASAEATEGMVPDGSMTAPPAPALADVALLANSRGIAHPFRRQTGGGESTGMGSSAGHAEQEAGEGDPPAALATPAAKFITNPTEEDVRPVRWCAGEWLKFRLMGR